MNNNNYYNINIIDDEQAEEDYKKAKRLKRAKYLISSLLAIIGLVILGTQLGPLGISYINGKILESQLNTIKDPAPAQELNSQNTDLPYYDPGLSYFQNVMQHIGEDGDYSISNGSSQSSSKVIVDKDYKKSMQITIESVNIKRINITPNVDSFNEKIYEKALKNGLAHFKGTPLPGDGGNSFIYGHSAVDSFFSNNPNKPSTIFSKLENVEISDKIYIYKDNKEFEYTVQKKKIADPKDFDVVSGIEGKETVTLMTCWPLGIGSQRLIVIGEITNAK
jgi:sortase A